MTTFAITHPVATVARQIENIILSGRSSKSLIYQGGCAVVSRAISLIVFPIFLMLELAFKRVPKLILAIRNPEKFNSRLDKVIKYTMAFFATPVFALHSPEGIPSFFLKQPPSNMIRPFGVEGLYGKKADLRFPKTVEEIQDIVINEKKQISIVGAGMSQGTQTIPQDNQIALNLKHLNQIEISENTVTVGAGVTWEQLHLALDKVGKSVRVKQASNPFSIGGSIGINCHGWAHEDGAISSTVESIDVVDADGLLHTLTPQDELFGCMFGTLGYFGIVVRAKLKIVDNECLIEKTEEIGLDDFARNYNEKIKGKDIPLFGGRLVLDMREDDPLRQVCMVRYEKDPDAQVTRNITLEPKMGTRIERIALKLISHLSNFSATRLLSWFWEKERCAMLSGRKVTRNEALHPPINAFKMLHHSNIHTQWLQEYFIKEENLPNFLRFLGTKLKANNVRLINATIRPTPKDTVSILPYAEQDRHAVVICFSQLKTKKAIQKTKKWIEQVNEYVIAAGDVYYQAYMPYATREQFEKCYGKERVESMRDLKQKYDPEHRFGNLHTAKYFDREEIHA